MSPRARFLLVALLSAGVAAPTIHIGLTAFGIYRFELALVLAAATGLAFAVSAARSQRRDVLVTPPSRKNNPDTDRR